MADLAPRRLRLLFWLVLGALSTAVPEVAAGSDLFPFSKVTDYLIVIPLYTLHTLVLWYIIWSRGEPRLYTLFPAGAIFGLYEAYMTKVLWDPTWAAFPLKFMGVAVVETLILVLFWHSFLAFMVPLLVAETSLTGSRTILAGLPRWMGEKLIWLRTGNHYLIVPVLAGLFQGINTPTLVDAALSGVSSTFILLVLFKLWRRTGGDRYTLRSLLPTRGEFRVLLALLLLYYVFMGVYWRPEALPGIGPQAVVWLLYLFFGGLLFIGLKKSRDDQSVNPDHNVMLSDRKILIFGVIFSISAVLGRATGLSMVAVYVVWFGGIIFGAYTLTKVLRLVFA